MNGSTGAGIDPAPVIARITYKPGWVLKVGGPLGMFLCVFVTAPDSAKPTRQRTTQHMFELPSFDDERTLCRWVLEQLLLAEQHEGCEFFALDERRPFFPNHQDEGSPYELVERWETT